MIKKILVVLVAFVTVFLTQSQVWAAVQNADKVQQSITIDKSTFFAKDAPDMLAMKMGKGGDNSILWIASIFIAGLGQILMGDLWRGLKFTLIVYGIPIILGIIGGVLTAGSIATGSYGIASIWWIVSLIGWIVALVFYIFNIIDAYNMAQEGAGMSNLNENDLAKLQQQLNAAVEFANNVKVSDNGVVSVRAMAF